MTLFLRQVVVTELAVIIYSKELDYDRSINFLAKKCIQTLLPLLNGLFAVTIVTSVIQRTDGTIKPFFLTICPAACAWPSTLIRTKSVEEDLETCFNGTNFSINSNHDHLKSLLEDARLSFPSFQEAAVAFLLIFITGYWHTKRVTRALSDWDAIRLLSFTAMIVILVLMSQSKMNRHKNWVSDIWCGIAIGVTFAVHQSVGWHALPSLRSAAQVKFPPQRNDFELQVTQPKPVVIPRANYRTSLVDMRKLHSSQQELREMRTGTTNPSFFCSNKQ